MRGTPRQAVWQRNYMDHLALNNLDADRIRAHFRNNPARWTGDRLDSCGMDEIESNISRRRWVGYLESYT